MSSSPEAHTSQHPTFKQYVVVAIILFAITLVEFLIIVPEAWQGTGAVIAPLVILSAVKFWIVIMFYMHLKFEHKRLTQIFITGLVLSFCVGAAVIGLFGSFTPEPRAFAVANAVAYAGHEAASSGHDAPAEHVTSDTPAQSGPDSDQAQSAPPTDTTPPSGSEGGSDMVAAQGQALFTGGSCAGCHTIDGLTAGMVGPDLTHIGTDAASRNDQSAAEYLEEAIRNPEAFVATGVERAIPGVMTSGLTAALSDEDVRSLVEFLLAQK